MNDTTALWSALGLVATALSSVSVATYRRLTVKLDECETKHDAAQKDLTEVSHNLGVLEGRVETIERENGHHQN